MTDEESKDPAAEEAEVPTKVMQGDSGGQDQPMTATEQHDPNKQGPASPADPSEQSGVPLTEDRAAGVERGEVPEPPAAPPVAPTPGL